MKFKQEMQMKVNVEVEPKYTVGDSVYMENEVGTIFISKVEGIKISNGECVYYVSFANGSIMQRGEESIKLYIHKSELPLH